MVTHWEEIDTEIISKIWPGINQKIQQFDIIMNLIAYPLTTTLTTNPEISNVRSYLLLRILVFYFLFFISIFMEAKSEILGSV